MFITIGIPTYEMKPNGARFLDFSLNRIYNQTYKNFEVVISDHSKDNAVEGIAKTWAKKLNVNYIRKTYKTDNPSSNLNNIFDQAKGDYIKILFQDDFLYNENAIAATVDAIINAKYPAWIVSTSEHSEDGENMIKEYHPVYHNKMHRGYNTISSPSVLTIKNDNNKMYFDEDFKWLMDCIYYRKCYDKFGAPTIIEKVTIVNRLWGNQLTNQLQLDVKQNEVLRAIKIFDSYPYYLYYYIKNKLKSKFKKC